MSDDLKERLQNWRHVYINDHDKPEGHLYEEASHRIAALEAEVERLQGALECLDIAVCGAAIPHAGERAVVQEAIKMARAALAEKGDE
jgi:hypothetical protein